MYADNTLTPKEATRLCALGILAGGNASYAELASNVRYFITHVMGPSLDVLGMSIELLKHEGLVKPVSGDGDQALLEITEEGRQELQTLLKANVKAAENDLNKLVVALKFLFLDCLSVEDQCDQMNMLGLTIENELARLEELRGHYSDDAGHLVDWLDREIEELVSRHDWIVQKRIALQAANKA
jgi:DNA-binding PadR family transcriptional regulator